MELIPLNWSILSPIIHYIPENICRPVSSECIGRNIKWLRKRTVDGYLHDMAQIFSIVGSNNPHLYNLVIIHIQFGHQTHTYSYMDPSPREYNCVPSPLSKSVGVFSIMATLTNRISPTYYTLNFSSSVSL